MKSLAPEDRGADEIVGIRRIQGKERGKNAPLAERGEEDDGKLEYEIERRFTISEPALCSKRIVSAWPKQSNRVLIPAGVSCWS